MPWVWVGWVKTPVQTFVPLSVIGSTGRRAARPAMLSRAREKRLRPMPPATALNGRLVMVERSRAKAKVLATDATTNAVASPMRTNACPGPNVAPTRLNGEVCSRSTTVRECGPEITTPMTAAHRMATTMAVTVRAAAVTDLTARVWDRRPGRANRYLRLPHAFSPATDSPAKMAAASGKTKSMSALRTRSGMTKPDVFGVTESQDPRRSDVAGRVIPMTSERTMERPATAARTPQVLGLRSCLDSSTAITPGHPAE